VAERLEEGHQYPVQRPVYYVSEVLSNSKVRYSQPQKMLVNTKNWYRKETDLWAEFGKETPFGRKFSSKHSVEVPAVGSTPSFGRRAVLCLEKETFGNT
jgi:uncharacterized protein (DUF488 family)